MFFEKLFFAFVGCVQAVLESVDAVAVLVQAWFCPFRFFAFASRTGVARVAVGFLVSRAAELGRTIMLFGTFVMLTRLLRRPTLGVQQCSHCSR